MSRADFDVRPINGPFRVLKAGRRRERLHLGFGAAEAAALRLAEADPGNTYVITQEIALVERVKERP